MEIRGLLYEAGSTRQQQAILHIDAKHDCRLRLANGSARFLGQFPDVEVSPRIGDTPRRLCFKDGSCLETDDHGVIEGLLQELQQHRSSRLLHRLERSLPLVGLFTVLLAVFFWLMTQYGIPAMARHVAMSLPGSVNQSLGAGTLQLLDKAILLPSQLEQQRQDKLLGQFSRYTALFPQQDIKVIFRDSENIGANALALPDGHIVFTDALVELAEDDLELVSILAHEIGHLQQRHLLRRAIQDSVLTIVIVLVTGDASSVSSLFYALPTLLMELAYSRRFEQEADDFAWQLLTEQGIETSHFANIMTRLEQSHLRQDEADNPPGMEAEKTSLGSYLSTHPATAERIHRFGRQGTESSR